jgi:ATP-binding cassette subfamily F protein uup
LEREKELNKYYNLQIEIKDLEIDKSKIDFLFSDEKVADADSSESESEQAKQIIGKANELQTIIQKMEEKDERWFELCAKMESLAP